MTANGKLNPATQLIAVEGQFLAPAMHRAYSDLQHAARAAGHEVELYKPAGGYRSEAVQEDMHTNPQHWNLLPGVTIADVGESRHGQGRAADIKAKNITGRTWVRANAARFGLSRPFPKTDPDHYELGTDVVHTTDMTPVVPEEPEREEMTRLFVNSSTLSSGGAPTSSTVWVIAGVPGTSANWFEFTEATHPGVRTAFEAAGGPATQRNSVEFAQLKAAYPVLSGGGSGGLTDAQVLDDGEAEQLLTSTANVINGHVTAAKTEILTAINSITLTNG